LEERLEDLVTLLQLQNAKKTQEIQTTPAVDAVSEPDIEHPWIPRIWNGGARKRKAAAQRSFSGPPAKVITSSSEYSLQGMNAPPPATAQSTNGFLASSSSVAVTPPTRAEKVLHHFRSNYATRTPFLYIPAETTAQQLQHERPFFWSVIRAICAPSLEERYELGLQVRGVLSQQLLVECERSIDLLLGLLAYLGWWDRSGEYIVSDEGLPLAQEYAFPSG
jgi:hypothetical protein